MSKTENQRLEIKSLNQWIDRYKITKYKDKEHESLMDDPEVFGATLANSTIDKLLKNRNQTKAST